MSRTLEEVINDFESTKYSYRDYISNGDNKRETLLEYQGRFTDLKSDLRPHHAKVVREWTNRDDKASTAIKYRICVAISKGEFKDEEGKLIYDECSINQAEKFASGSDKYKTFIDQRAFWKESLANIQDLRDDISSYLIEISNRLR